MPRKAGKGGSKPKASAKAKKPKPPPVVYDQTNPLVLYRRFAYRQ